MRKNVQPSFLGQCWCLVRTKREGLNGKNSNVKPILTFLTSNLTTLSKSRTLTARHDLTNLNSRSKVVCVWPAMTGHSDALIDFRIPNRSAMRFLSQGMSAATIIARVFNNDTEDEELPSNESPSNESLQHHPYVKHATNRKRYFLLDAGAYKLSSLEKLKTLEQIFDKEDEERFKWLTSSAVKMSSLSSSEIMRIVDSLSRAPRIKITPALFRLLSSRQLTNVACQCSMNCPDDEFCNILMALYKVHSVLTSEQLHILRTECKRRLLTMDANNILLMSDWWLRIQQRSSPFYRSVLQTLSENPERLTVHNVVQTLYLMGECMQFHSDEFLQGLTHVLERHMDSLTWNELGTMCNAFIKLQSRIKSRPLQRSLNVRICHDLHSNTLDHYNLITVLRFISRAYFHDWHVFEDIACSLTPHIASMPYIAPPHIAAAFAKVRHFNQPLMDTIASRALQMDDSARFKDIWMLLWAYCRFNYHPPHCKDLFQKLIHRMLVKPVQVDKPYLFIKALVSLTFVGHFPAPLIHAAFSQRCLEQCEAICPKDVYKHLYVLDSSIAIEQPEYHGNRLPQKYVDKFWQSPHGSKSVPLEKIYGLKEAITGLQCILGGSEYVKVHPILPHIRTPLDIEVHLDSSNAPLPFPCEHSSAHPRQKTTASWKDDKQRLAVLVAPKGDYRYHSRTLLGVHVMKRRQLNMVGYRVVEIPYYDWEPLLQSSTSRQQEYLKNKIFNPVLHSV